MISTERDRELKESNRTRLWQHMRRRISRRTEQRATARPWSSAALSWYRCELWELSAYTKVPTEFQSLESIGLVVYTLIKTKGTNLTVCLYDRIEKLDRVTHLRPHQPG